MKKFLSVILMFSMLAVNVYAANPKMLVDIPEKAELQENQYLVTVDILENPGFVSLQMELYYNDEVISCTRVVPGETVKGMLTDSNPSAKGERTSAVFSVAGTENSTGNGNIATFVFEKPDSGNPEFEFSLIELRNSDGALIECDVEINNNYGETEAVPDEKEPSSGGTVSRPSYSGGSSSGKGNAGQIVIHDELKPTVVVFADFDTSHWAYEYINEAVALGIINGYTDKTFMPDKEMTRAEFATLLWNMENKPVAQTEIPFTDVNQGDWFYNQIVWAFDKEYIKGTSESEFSPNGTITREQAMTILYRYAGSPEVKETLEKFEDIEKISDFALSAMSWAVENKIISGVSDTEIAPKMSATRAQLATIIVRYLKQ